MRMHTTWLAVPALILMLAAVPAAAGVLYDNGPANGTFSGWTINFGFAVADSFDLSGDSTITGVNLALWAEPGDTPLSVDWLITTDPFGTAVPGGSATGVDLINGVPYANEYGFDVFQDSFAIPDLALASGTYWLELQNAAVGSGNPVFWDVNDGPSVAYENTLGNVANNLEAGSNSDTFQILGTSGAATPEPGSMLLLGAGLLLAGRLRRKARA